MGRQKRCMPKKEDIALHWNKKYNVDFDTVHCWGCGFPDASDRAHIVAKCYGGDDSEENLVLLCRLCHNHIQEVMPTTTNEDADSFKLSILDHMPFFGIKYNFMLSKVKHGVYDRLTDNDLLSIGITREQLNKIKLNL